MKDQNKTKEQLLKEIKLLQAKVAKLEKPEIPRKNAEEVLENIFHLSQDIMGIFTTDGKLLRVNPAWERILGYSQEELRGLGWIKLVHPDDLERTNTEVEKQLKGSPVVNFVNRYRHKDGSYITLEWQASFAKKGIVFATARDIAERKNAEDKIKIQQYYLEKAQEIGAIGTWELDIVKNILIWTDQNYLNFGVPLGTPLTYEIFLHCLHPEDREYVNTEWMAAIKGKAYDIEHRIIIDGKIRWLREKADITFDEKGNGIYAIGFTQDITERKQAEVALQESAEKYRTLFEGYTNPVTIMDRDGIILMINAAGAKRMGVPQKDCIGKLIFDILPSLDESYLKNYRQATDEGKTVIKENYVKLSGGSRWYLSFYSPVSDISGKIYGVQIISHDITERKQAEEKLKESKEQLNAFFRNSPIGLAIWDKNFRYTYINDVLQKINGPSLKEHLGKTVQEVLPDAAPIIVPLFKKILSSGKPINNLELSGEVPSRPGEITHYLVSYFPISVNENGPLMIGGAVLDITERKKAEDELKEQNKLNHLRAEFWQVVSDRSINRDELTYRLLEKVGSTLEISRASYLELDHERHEFVTKHQWFLPEAGTTKGVTIPVRYAKHYYGKNYVELPKDMKPVVRTFAKTIMQRNNIKSYLVVPYGDKNNPEAFFTFTDCNKKKEWSEFEKEVLFELIKILETSSKQIDAEEAQRESEENFRNIIENLPLGMHIYKLEPDGQLRFEAANPAADKILGIDNSQYIGKTILEAFPEIHKTDIPERFRIIAEKGGFWKKESIDYKDNNFSGSFENYNYQISPGKMVSMFQDITERKQTEKSLEEKQQLNKLLLDSLPHPAMLINTKWIVQAANKAAVDIGVKFGDYCWKGFGKCEYLSDENKKLAEENPDDERIRCTFCMADQAMKGPELKRMNDPEVHAFDKIWDTYWDPIDKETFLHYAIDITERKQAEEKLKGRQRELQTFYDAAVGRELKVIELKKEINEMLEKAGEKTKYEIPV